MKKEALKRTAALVLASSIMMLGLLPTSIVQARGRYGSHRIGGYTSHGKGSHYVGGYVRGGSSYRSRSGGR